MIISKKSRAGSLKVVAYPQRSPGRCRPGYDCSQDVIVATLTPWKFPAPVYRTVRGG